MCVWTDRRMERPEIIKNQRLRSSDRYRKLYLIITIILITQCPSVCVFVCLHANTYYLVVYTEVEIVFDTCITNDLQLLFRTNIFSVEGAKVGAVHFLGVLKQKAKKIKPHLPFGILRAHYWWITRSAHGGIVSNDDILNREIADVFLSFFFFLCFVYKYNFDRFTKSRINNKCRMVCVKSE